MIRIGVDFGGTKIEAAALDRDGRFRARVRAATPRDYAASLVAVRDLVVEAERQAGAGGKRFVGVATPGSISPKTGLLRNANSLWLNGKPFREDLGATLGAPVRMVNDANCLALSEARDGAAAGAAVVFAAILGTGCGGGLAMHGRVVTGANAIAGEWGHTPLPWPNADEHPAPPCWCGRPGCLELYVSGTGFEVDHRRATGHTLAGAEIAALARAGDAPAAATLARYLDRLGRALAVICNIVDPDVIVLGGGMSNLPELYARLPQEIGRWIFSDVFATPVVPAQYGDSSGVRGAAMLWDADE
ncbi:MAG TPA: ROK family protein [Xanthobacteraceae bacterium]|nr:ROK family protein [Xanthobacteraceae bacterium]